jgi:hypothetical protein
VLDGHVVAEIFKTGYKTLGDALLILFIEVMGPRSM